MIRLLLVDDHKLMREALCSILETEPDILVVGQADDGVSAVRLCRELRPDVVLMDIALPDICGIEVTRRLIAENKSVRVLAVSSYIERSFIIRMLEAGATGYVHKSAGREEVLQGIRSVIVGKPYLSPDVMAMVLEDAGHQDKYRAEPKLCKREIQVLKLVAEGNTTLQIAAQLHIATGTVDVHRRNIIFKLDLHTVADLTKYAIREGMTSP